MWSAAFKASPRNSNFWPHFCFRGSTLGESHLTWSLSTLGWLVAPAVEPGLSHPAGGSMLDQDGESSISFRT